MGVGKFLGSFVQATFFGGTYGDISFELRVLKNEIAALHARMDKELDGLSARLDGLEGKPGAGKGRGRLVVVGAAEVADGPPEQELAPPPSAPPAAPGGGTFGPEMTVREAWDAHPLAPAIFGAHHLPGCPDCPLSTRETLARGAGGHGLDVEALLRDLNQLADA